MLMYVKLKVKKVLVILNLSGKEQTITVKIPVCSRTNECVYGVKRKTYGQTWNIEPWGYVIYVY